MLGASTHMLRGRPRGRGSVCCELVRSGWNDLQLHAINITFKHLEVLIVIE